VNFFYIVLDEAHKIKNSKSKITQRIKELKGDRKLVLSGTPLQNKVSELWSLFDFLMPDFLEEETVFNKTYNKYLTANIKKMSEKLEDTQSFIEALRSLKRRIAPFILRRTKE
jgi:TATA-binding protein-associated factor